jgi:hypothetical protein
MVDRSALRADRYREIARELRCVAFNQVNLCRKSQLMALSEGFDRFADRIEQATEQATEMAAD